tara:strand:+ start:4697 stop:4936 length:240 start_codon:yes stop_codon:yes gene_type:complete
MSDALEILTGYGALGCWVVFSIIRERILMAKIDQLTLRFESERMRWDRERTRWLKTLGRKLSDRTIDETIGRELKELGL